MGEPNILLKALIQEAGFSNAGLAKRIRAAGLDLRYDHTSVARWIRDRAIPRGQVPEIICDLLGERLGRKLTPADIGMEPAATEALTADQLVQRASARWNSDATSRKII